MGYYFNNQSLPRDAQIYRKKLTVLYAVTNTIFLPYPCVIRWVRLRTVIRRIFLIRGRTADLSYTKNILIGNFL